MTPEFLHDFALVPALRLLPSQMDTPPARAMCVAIALQESQIAYRHQVGGPAAGYYQFELGGGVQGVLTHSLTKGLIRSVLTMLDYDPAADATTCHRLIEHNDVLASAFARLLLYTVPKRLPERDEANAAWLQYLSAWRPGKPRPGRWAANFEHAWRVVE